MTETEEIRKKAIVRMDIVQLYMMRNMAVTMFARLDNAGDISRQLLEESGPIEADDLDRWADTCMEVEKKKNEISGSGFCGGLKNSVRKKTVVTRLRKVSPNVWAKGRR
jgi:hypothetical protein